MCNNNCNGNCNCNNSYNFSSACNPCANGGTTPPDTPNLLDCNTLEDTMETLKRKFKSCAVLEAADLDLLVDVIYSVKECPNQSEELLNNIVINFSLPDVTDELEITSQINILPTFEVDETNIAFFNVKVGDVESVYVLKPGKGIYGLSGDVLLSPGDVYKISGQAQATNTVEGTWQELEALRSNNELIIGNTYILTDYQTQYIIEGTDSADKEDILEVTGTASGYARFDCVDESIINSNGDTAFVEELPVGYTGPLVVGDLLTVNAYFNCAFIRFTPSLTTTGVKIKVVQARYPNVPTDTLLLDDFGKPILKPGGVLNTDVHDGTPYLKMSAVDNPIVPTERIALKAINSNTFSIDAESLTYVGDTLKYDFEDINLEDGNGNSTGLFRRGFINKRTNLEDTVSVDKDWRVQRYRRYKIDQANFNLISHQQSQSGGSVALYNYNSNNSFAPANTINEEHKYIARFPFELGYYIDFTKINDNPFLSGGPGLNPSTGLNFPSGANVKVDLEIPFADLQECKDFFIFPIENNDKTLLTTKFKVGNLENTIFRLNSQTFGNTEPIFVEVVKRLSNSSMMSGTNVVASISNLDKIITLDRYYVIHNSSTDMVGFTSFAYGSIQNNGVIQDVFIGSDANSSTPLNVFNETKITQGAELFYTMIGGKRPQNFEIKAKMSHCLIRMENSLSTVIDGLMFLTTFVSNNATNTVNSGYTVTLNTYAQQIPGKGDNGFQYVFNLLPSNAFLNNDNFNKEIVYNNVDANQNISLITEVIPT